MLVGALRRSLVDCRCRQCYVDQGNSTLCGSVFYPRDRGGRVRRFDDLPPAFAANVNKEPPFVIDSPGRGSLSSREQADIIAFLGALTDGWRP